MYICDWYLGKAVSVKTKSIFNFVFTFVNMLWWNYYSCNLIEKNLCKRLILLVDNKLERIESILKKALISLANGKYNSFM